MNRKMQKTELIFNAMRGIKLQKARKYRMEAKSFPVNNAIEPTCLSGLNVIAQIHKE